MSRHTGPQSMEAWMDRGQDGASRLHTGRVHPEHPDLNGRQKRGPTFRKATLEDTFCLWDLRAGWVLGHPFQCLHRQDATWPGQSRQRLWSCGHIPVVSGIVQTCHRAPEVWPLPFQSGPVWKTAYAMRPCPSI